MLGAAPLAEVGVKVRGAGARPVSLVGPRRSWFANLWGSRHASKWWCCNLQCLGTVMPFDGVGRTPQGIALPVFLVVVVK